MTDPRIRVALLAWAVIGLQIAPSTNAGESPGGPWLQIADLEAAGWSPTKLEQAFELATQVESASVFAVHDGTVVVAWGEIDRSFPIFSMRKGMYNALAGIAVEEGVIELETTLAELEIDDLEGLTGDERSATFEDLLTSRSGVYHPAAYEPGSMKRNRPKRGGHPPGTHWFYNNWDFNTAAHIIAESLGGTIAEQFDERIAIPLGMEDFARADVFDFLEPGNSRFPAPVFRMSARDLARVGLLYLREGDWGGEILLPGDWIEKSFTPTSVFPANSRFGAGNGFGYLWWVYPATEGAEQPSRRHGGIVTRGNHGQVLAVMPALDMVLVHQTDTENGRSAGFGDAMRVLDAIMSSYHGPGDGTTETTPLETRPLPTALPAPPVRRATPWTRGWIDLLVGEFRMSPQVTMEVFEMEGRLFARPRGAPLGEAELFHEASVDGPQRVFSPAVDLLLEFRRERNGSVERLSGRIDGRQVEVVRIDS